MGICDVSLTYSRKYHFASIMVSASFAMSIVLRYLAPLIICFWCMKSPAAYLLYSRKELPSMSTVFAELWIRKRRRGNDSWFRPCHWDKVMNPSLSTHNHVLRKIPIIYPMPLQKLKITDLLELAFSNQFFWNTNSKL